MKPAVVIHLKEKSQRLKGKNFKKINNKPLFEITFQKLKKNKDFFDVYIDSSSSYFENLADKYKFNFIKRPERLNRPDAQGNELLEQCVKNINNDIILQLFVTNPLMKINTLKKIYNKIKKARVDSVTAIAPIYNRFWFKNKEVNHKYNKLIGTQFMKPVYVEAGVYCFRKKSFLKEKSRICKKNLLYQIDELESFDIDNELDFIIAEKLLKKFKC